MGDIELEIKRWVIRELKDARLQGVTAKELKKGICVAMKKLTEIAVNQVDKSEAYHKKYGRD